MSDLLVDGAVRVERLIGTGMITIRADLSDSKVSQSISGATGCSLPSIREVVHQAGRSLCWMSPDELLLVAPSGEVPGLIDALMTGLAGAHHLVVDMSDARAHFRLTGAGAREVLAKGAPVDLSREAFGPRQIRRTRLGQVAAAFWMSDETQFELVCFASVGGFVAEWLQVAAQDGTLPEIL